MRSIRAYLLSRLLAGVALLLLGAGALVYALVARSIGAQFDLALAERVQGFASILFQTRERLSFEFSDELMPEFARANEPEYFQLWFADGRPIERSESLGGDGDDARDLALAVEPGEEPAFWTAPLPDGREGRYVAQRIVVHHVYPEEGPGRPEAARVHVALARGTEALVAAQRSALLACVGCSLGLLALIALVAWQAVRRGLRPAERLAATLDAIRVERLPQRLDAGPLPRELQPIAQTTDALLARVDAAFQRERRTTADIAHELRTPISELITSSEVALRGGDDPEGGLRTLDLVRQVAWRMERSVSILLQLARLDTDAESFEQVPVNLGELVHECLGSQRGAIRARALRVLNGVPMDTWVEGDPEVLRIIVANLVANAVAYAPPATPIACELVAAGGGWQLTIENEAGELAPSDLDSLTQPFWRKDGARSDRDRSGLGLALSRALAERTGLALGFALEDGLFRASVAGGATGRAAALG